MERSAGAPFALHAPSHAIIDSEPCDFMTTRILLFTHAPLAQALRECALHVFADSAEDVLALDVPAQEPPEATLMRAEPAGAAHAGADRPLWCDALQRGAAPCGATACRAAGGRSELAHAAALHRLSPRGAGSRGRACLGGRQPWGDAGGREHASEPESATIQ